MKKITILPMIAIVAFGLAACSKPADTENVSAADTNTVIEESDANFSAVDGVNTENSTDVANTSDLNAVDSNTAANAF